MKKIIAISLLMLISISVTTALIGHVYPYRVKVGETLELVVTYVNEMKSNVHDLQLTVYFPELDTKEKSHEFDVKRQSASRSKIILDIPEDVKPDFYPVILSLQNDEGYREKTHTWIEIYS